MSITISRMHEVDSWEMAVASGEVTKGTAEDVLRALAARMGCKLQITEQRVGTYEYPQSDTERGRLIAERNADGRHPIG